MLVARHPNRPTVLDYVNRLFTEFTEISGDRRFADDHAIVAGFARYKGEPVLVVGHHKGGGGDTKQKIYPQLRLREARGLPQGAAGDEAGGEVQPAGASRSSTRRRRIPGIESEERGISEAIASNLREMAALDTPIIVVVHGEGGSGGALGLAVGDRILMHEFAIYSVIPPEGCAAILWRDSEPQGRSGRGAQADGAGSAAARHHRRDRPGADRRRAHQPRAGGDAARRALSARARRGLGDGVGSAPRRALPEVARDGQRRHRAEGMTSRIWQRGRCDDARSAALVRASWASRRSPRGCCASAGSATSSGARRFLSPSLDDLHDPFPLADMAPAVERILGAIARQERIAIHGDYDVDGVTSTVILRRALELLGADVMHFIPERLRDGYGLQPAALDRLHADGVRLVISVDCGIRGVEAALHARDARARSDHHRPSRARRRAAAARSP